MMNSGRLAPERNGERRLRLLESAPGQQPRDPVIREAKVQVLLQMGRPTEALAETRLALAGRPRNWRLLASAAATAEGEGQTDLALDYWRRAVEINPCAAEFQERLVLLLTRAGKPDEARARCRKLLRARPVQRDGAAGVRWASCCARARRRRLARRLT